MTGRYYLNNVNNVKSNNIFIIVDGSDKSNNNFYYREEKEFKSSKWFGQIISFNQFFSEK